MVGKSWIWCYDQLVEEYHVKKQEGLVFKIDFKKAYGHVD